MTPGGHDTGRCGMPMAKAHQVGRACLVQVVDSGFALNARPVVPQGVNSYPLLQLAGQGRWDAVRDILHQAKRLGRPVVRTNAFMDGGDNPARLREADLSIREPGLCVLDGVVARAAEARVRLLLVLTNNWADFGGAPLVVRALAPDGSLTKDAFWSDARAIDHQRAYLRTLVRRVNSVTRERYANDPTVFAWELANEARLASADARERRSGSILAGWARAMAAEIRAAGAQQPIAWGGSGYRGRFAENMTTLARDRAVDILTLHLYPQLFVPFITRLPARARVSAAIAVGAGLMLDRARLARRYGLPLIVEEIGYKAPSFARDADRERATVMRGLLAVARRLGLATFPWMIGESGRADTDGFLIRAGDTATWRALECEVPMPWECPRP
jgi:endo-1,4-beta-mannosidase